MFKCLKLSSVIVSSLKTVIQAVETPVCKMWISFYFFISIFRFIHTPVGFKCFAHVVKISVYCNIFSLIRLLTSLITCIKQFSDTGYIVYL